jgi:hypothetical protein
MPTFSVPKNIVRPLILIGAVTLLAGILYTAEHGFTFPGAGPATASALDTYATEIIETCAKDSYPPRCYDIEIPKLMDRGLTLEEAFDVTRLVQNRVGNYFYCHVLGHNISAKETAKDPSKWTEVIGRCPTGMCSNGCLHGAAQERFRSESLTDDQIEEITPEIAAICENGRNFTGLEQASCYHSLGHLTMYLTAADIDKSTAICNVIAKKGEKDYTQTCYEGAYMQIFQPLEPEDFALVEDIAPKTTTEAEAFCDSYEGEYRAACHRESWPLYRESLVEPEGLTRFCSLVPNPLSEQRCYNAMFYVLAAQFNFDDRMVPLCEGLPEKKRMAQCFANFSSRMVETDYRLTPRAIELCKTADEHGVGERCYDELLFYSTFNFHKDTDSFNQLCNALPEPWKSKCFSGEGNQVHPSRADFM